MQETTLGQTYSTITYSKGDQFKPQNNPSLWSNKKPSLIQTITFHLSTLIMTLTLSFTNNCWALSGWCQKETTERFLNSTTIKCAKTTMIQRFFGTESELACSKVTFLLANSYHIHGIMSGGWIWALAILMMPCGKSLLKTLTISRAWCSSTLTGIRSKQ